MSCSCFDECVYESTAQSFPFVFLFSLIILFAILIFKVYTLQIQVFDLEAKIDLIKIFVKSKIVDDEKIKSDGDEKKDKKVVKSFEFEKKTLSEIFKDLKTNDEKIQADEKLKKEEDVEDDGNYDKKEDVINKDEIDSKDEKILNEDKNVDLTKDIKIVKKKSKKSKL